MGHQESGYVPFLCSGVVAAQSLAPSLAAAPSPSASNTVEACRHELQRETERLASFPPRTRDKTSRPVRDNRRRRTARADKTMLSSSTLLGSGEMDEPMRQYVTQNNVYDDGDEPLSYTELSSLLTVGDEAVLSPRSSLVLSDTPCVYQKLLLDVSCHEWNPPSPVQALNECPVYKRFTSRRRHTRSGDASYKNGPSRVAQITALTRAHSEPLLSVDRGVVGCRSVLRPCDTPIDTSAVDISLLATVDDVTQHLDQLRRSSGRPCLPEAMTPAQITDEKVALQKALLYLENTHGRPKQRQDRDLVRPLYERYRLVKRLAAQPTSTRSRDSVGELTTIMEHETLCFSAAAPSVSTTGSQTPAEPPCLTPAPPDELTRSVDNLHNMSTCELRDHLRAAKHEKKRLKESLTQFESCYRSNVGKKVQKELRGEMATTYTDYKQVKAKIKLLEVLLAKDHHRMSL